MSQTTSGYTPPEVTHTPDMSRAWHRSQVLPLMIPGLGWLVEPEQQPKPQTYPPPAIMEPDSLERIERKYQAWVRTWKGTNHAT